MSRQNTQSDSNLKRQLTFLKTIDQKLEGLRRENERLLRLTDNPRVAFSRSSLAGTYRIVNSLISAGPMYGLTDIERWAKENRDWLISLGKRGADPAPEEMERLQKSIGELSRLRDEAVAGAEKNSKNTVSSPKGTQGEEEELVSFEPEPIGEDAAHDSAINAYASTDTAASGSKSAETGAVPDTGFPFSDEPKATSINDSAFAPKPKPAPKKKPDKKPGMNHSPKHIRERTSTIPLAIDDLAMLGTTSKIPPGISRTKFGPEFWKIFAIASFLGFTVMTILYIREVGRPTPPPPAAAPTQQPAAPAKAPLEIAQPSPSPAVENEAGKSAQTAVSASEAEAAVSEVKTEAAPPEKPEPKEPAVKSSSKEKNKDRKKEKTKSSASVDKSASKSSSKPSAGEPKGILFVKAPEDGTPVFVLVDGTSRGKAPVKTVLSPGLHEVVFTANGKRSMRMVPIKADNTKTIVAVKPN